MDELLRTSSLIVALLQAPATAVVPDGPVVAAGTVMPGVAVLPRVADAPRVQEPKRDRWLGSDKPRHFWMSYATTVFSFAAVTAAGEDGDTALRVAVPVGAVAGIGKEIYDRRRGEHFSVRDLVADALGIAAAYFVLREVR